MPWDLKISPLQNVLIDPIKHVGRPYNPEHTETYSSWSARVYCSAAVNGLAVGR